MADNQFIFDFLVGKDDVTPTMDKTRKSTQNFGESVDRMGRQSMIAMRSFGEAGKLAGFSDELVKATYNAANMTDVVGDMAGAMAMLNPIMLGVAAVGMGVALMAQQVSAAGAPMRELDERLASLAKQDNTAKTLANISGATEAQAKEALIAAGASKEYADQLLRLERAAQGDVWGNRLAQIQGGGGDLGGGLIDSLKNLGKQYISVAAATGEFVASGGDAARAQSVYNEMLAGTPEELARVAQAQKDLNAAVTETAPAVLAHNRAMDVYKSAIPQAASALQSYNKQVRDMAEAHNRAQSAFGKDQAKAIEQAARRMADIQSDLADRTGEIQENLAERIGEIQSDLVERVGEIESSAIERRSEAWRDYASNIEDLNRDIAESARDAAQEMQAINDRAFEDEIGAKTWAEVQAIRRKAQAERDAKAEDNRETLDKFALRRRKIDEDYRHSEEVRQRDLTRAIEAAQKQANAQIEQGRRASEKQIEQSQKQADKQIEAARRSEGEQIAAIRERAAEEEAAYARNKASAYSNFQTQLTALFDLRTDAQKYSDAWTLLNAKLDPVTAKMISIRDINREIANESGAAYDALGNLISNAIIKWDRNAFSSGFN